MKMSFRIFAGIACLSIIVVIWMSLWYMPSILQNIGDNRKNVEAMEFRVQELKKYQAEYPDEAKHMKEVQKQNYAVRMRLPDNLDIAAFASQLQRSGRESGIEIKGLKPGKVSLTGEYSSQQIELALSGDYFAVSGLLRQLHEHERFCRVESMEVRVTSSGIEWGLLMEIYAFTDKFSIST